MKIYIDNVLGKTVFFSTEFGKGKGIWKTDSVQNKREYTVEFDIDKLYNYDDFILSSMGDYQIDIYNGKVCLTLLLLEYDEFGCATFRFGDSIIEIETSFDERFGKLVNSYVTVYVEKLDVYDENV